MQTAQVIALLMPETSTEVVTGANALARLTALLRDAQGNITIETMTAAAAKSDNTFMDQIMNTGCFRRGKAIVDPVSREVMGYEMEQMAHPLT